MESRRVAERCRWVDSKRVPRAGLVFLLGLSQLWGHQDMRERRAALSLAAKSAPSSSATTSRTTPFCPFSLVKIRAKSAADLHCAQPSAASEPEYSSDSAGAYARDNWTWWMKQECLCPGSREPGMGLWASGGVSGTCLSLAEAG